MRREEERGQLITGLREQRLWTRQRLAKEACVSPATVAGVEEGTTHIRLSTIGKLAEALEVDPQELLHPKAPTPTSPPPDEERRLTPEMYPELEDRFTKLAADFEDILSRCRRLMSRPDFDADLAWATKTTSEHYYNFADRYFNVVEVLNAVQDAAGAGEDVPESLLRAAEDLRVVLFGTRGVQGVGAAALGRARTDSPSAQLPLLDNSAEAKARERSA